MLASTHAAAAFSPVRSKVLPRRVVTNEAIAVFGGSGQLGSEVVYQTLQQGEAVATLVRDKSKLVVPKGSGGALAGQPLTGAFVVEGTVTSQEDVDRVFANNDITGAVVCLGGKTKNVGKTMLFDGTACVVDACKRFGVKRIAVVTSIGCGSSESQAPFFFKILMKTMMSSIFADKNKQGE